MGLPMYVYGEAMADKNPSNVRDMAKQAALDRYELNITKGFTWKSFTESHKAGTAASTPSDPTTSSAAVPTGAATDQKLRRVIATHHKTGTALMHDIFKTIAANFSYTFVNIRDIEDHPWKLKDNLGADKNATSCDIVLDYHLGKRLPKFMVGDDAAAQCQSLPGLYRPYRMVHIVRNPVDVLVSGFLYHRRNPEDEQWLFEPVKELGGQSYADHLRSATPDAAMMAEVGMADDELRMLALAHRDVERDPDAINIQLESFFRDFDGAVRGMLRFLQFPEADIERMVAAASAHDMRRWSKEELKRNEHFTQSEDREPYKGVIIRPGFLNKTMAYMRYAMGYEDAFPAFPH